MAKRIVVLLLLCVGALGCARIEIESQNYQFNEGIGNLNSQLLLLNAVRASKRYPLQFTYTNNYTGQGRYDGQLAGTFPFGPGVLNPIYNLNPLVKVNTGVNQVQVTDLNSTKAMQYLKYAISGSDFRYYYIHNGDRNLSLLALLLIDYIRIKPELFDEMKSEARRLCRAGDARFATEGAAFKQQCNYIEYYIAKCTGGRSIPTSAFGTQTLLIFGPRYTGDECYDRQIRLAGFVMQILGFNIQGDPAEQADKPKAGSSSDSGSGQRSRGPSSRSRPEDDSTSSKPKEPALGVSRGIFFFAHPKFEQRTKVTKVTKVGKDKIEETPLDVTFRSPESMVRFLGLLITAQTQHPDLAPTVYDFATNTEVPIFTVRRGLALPAETAVAVRDGEGDFFYIPIPDRTGANKDLTLETLSIVADVLSSATAQAEIPPVPNITLKVAP